MLHKLAHFLGLSVASITVCFLLTSFVIVSGIWNLSYQNGSIFDQLFGPNSANSASVTNFRSSIEQSQMQFNDNRFLERLPTLIFWLLLGCFVYILLESIISFTTTISQLKQEVNYVHADRKNLYKNITTKAVTKILFASIGAVYSYVFFKYVVGYVSVCLRIASNNIFNRVGLQYTAVAALLLFVGIHIYIICLRLFLLRPRISGESDATEA